MSRNEAMGDVASSPPPEQMAAINSPEGGSKKFARTQRMAENRQPGIHLWRSEVRDPTVTSDPVPDSVGLHWTAHPEAVVGQDRPGTTIFHALLTDPEAAIPRSHHMWGGGHYSMDWESEVRFKPGADVHVLGRYDQTAPYDPEAFHVPDTVFDPLGSGYGVTHKGFKYTRIDQSVPAEQVEGGVSDYTDVGLPKKTPYSTWRSRQFTERGLA